MLREDLLRGRAIALAGGAPDAVREALRRLGARLEILDEDAAAGGEEEQVGEWARARAPLHGLVYDAGDAFGGGGQTALRSALERGWVATREVATGALLPGEAGKVVLLGPRPDAGAFADAARAALENLARTLSVEWARFGVTATMIAPGASTTDQQLAELVSYLVSPAGEYFSGCRFDLGTVGHAR